jgi:hypothetical protein
MKRCGRKCHQVSLINLKEVNNETKEKKNSTKGKKIFSNDLKNVFLES